MSLTVRVEFVAGRYEAALPDKVTPEWPPHPARLFCALVDAARDEEDDKALRWLESQRPPAIIAPRKPLSTVTRISYVVLGEVPAKASTATNSWHPGRPTGRWQRSSAGLSSREIAFVWDEARPDAHVPVLRRLAERVPYLGRSTSPVLCEVQTDEGLPVPPAAYRPVNASEPGSLPVRIPFPGYLEALRQRYRAGDHAWEASRSIAYAWGLAANGSEPPRPTSAGWADLIVLGFPRGLLIEGPMLPRVTQAFRAQVMRLVQQALGSGVPLPVSVHGHHDRRTDYRPVHAAFLALPFVGAEHANGHLLGVAVALPEAMPSEDRQALLRVLVGAGGPRRLALRDVGEIEVAYNPFRTRPWGLMRERWIGPAKTWVSATPMVCDTHPKHGAWATAVVESLRRAGLPEPRDLEVSSGPMLLGAPRLLAREMPGRTDRYPPMCHARLRFDTAIRGPVVAGRLRYLGIGLFAPDRDEARGVPG